MVKRLLGIYINVAFVIDRAEMKQARRFSDRGTAFDAAVLALKGVLADAGYHETDGGYEK